jgi:hypothetical protein
VHGSKQGLEMLWRLWKAFGKSFLPGALCLWSFSSIVFHLFHCRKKE